MAGRTIILRHAETAIDRATPAINWHLTEDGRFRSYSHAETGIFDDVTSIYSSSEQKAISTVMPFAQRLGLEVETLYNLNELDRGLGPSLSKDEYLRNVRDVLSFPSRPVEGWENPEDALSRFRNAIESISHNDIDVLVISHGLVMSLYFAECLGQRKLAFERWRKLEFLSWGAISSGKVLKDIV